MKLITRVTYNIGSTQENLTGLENLKDSTFSDEVLFNCQLHLNKNTIKDIQGIKFQNCIVIIDGDIIMPLSKQEIKDFFVNLQCVNLLFSFCFGPSEELKLEPICLALNQRIKDSPKDIIVKNCMASDIQPFFDYMNSDTLSHIIFLDNRHSNFDASKIASMKTNDKTRLPLC